MRRPPLAAALIAVLGLFLTIPAAPAGAVFGGTAADEATNPAMALVATETSQCGGTLVTSTKVVTAAHCVSGVPAAGVWVALGVIDRDSLDWAGLSDFSRVTKVTIHPDYAGGITFDVAVLTLETTSTQPPARLVRASEATLWDAGTDARVTGWGTTGTGTPSTLQVANMPIVNDTTCQGIVGEAQQFVCAGDTDAEACAGDSGGPLLVEDVAGTPVLAGVLVAGDMSCGSGIPDAFARVGSDPMNTWLRTQIDSRSPKVIDQAPTGTTVSRGTSVVATFSEKMTPASINRSTFVLSRLRTDGAHKVSDVTVSLRADGLSAKLNPFGASAGRLARDARYRVEVTTAARDWVGNRLDQDRTVDGPQRKEWMFRTVR